MLDQIYDAIKKRQFHWNMFIVFVGIWYLLSENGAFKKITPYFY